MPAATAPDRRGGIGANSPETPTLPLHARPSAQNENGLPIGKPLISLVAGARNHRRFMVTMPPVLI